LVKKPHFNKDLLSNPKRINVKLVNQVTFQQNVVNVKIF